MACVLVAVEVVDMRALRVLDEERPWLIAAEVAGDTEGQTRFGFFQCGARGWCARFKGGEFFFEKLVHTDHPLPGAGGKGSTGQRDGNCWCGHRLQIRHGERRAQEGFTAGVPDEPALAAVGASDAEAAGEYLREDGFAEAKEAGKAAENRLAIADGNCNRAATTFAIGG
jgi:hypothetical protein